MNDWKRSLTEMKSTTFSFTFSCYSCVNVGFLCFYFPLYPCDVRRRFRIHTQFIVTLYLHYILLKFYSNDGKENVLPNLQVFNEFNARKPDSFNIFKGVTRNYLFMGIVATTVVLQVSNRY